MDAFNQKNLPRLVYSPYFILSEIMDLDFSPCFDPLIFYINELAYCGHGCFFPTQEFTKKEILKPQEWTELHLGGRSC